MDLARGFVTPMIVLGMFQKPSGQKSGSIGRPPVLGFVAPRLSSILEVGEECANQANSNQIWAVLSRPEVGEELVSCGKSAETRSPMIN